MGIRAAVAAVAPASLLLCVLLASTAVEVSAASAVSPQCVTFTAGRYAMGTNCTGASVVVTGTYARGMEALGWDKLELTSSAAFPDGVQAFAAGFFEGAVTVDAVGEWFANIPGPHGSAPVNDDIKNFLRTNANWIEQQVAARGDTTDVYWHHVGLMWAQFSGMLAGLNSVAPGGYDAVALLELTGQGDLLDLVNKFPGDGAGPPQRSWRNMTQPEFVRWLARRTHCSALVKHVPATGELFFGHATWQEYNSMLRILKTVTLNYNHGAAAKTIKYSSWPGALSSEDDYYLTSSGLAVIETSLSVFEDSIYSQVTPQTLPSWLRVMVANRIATGGRQWAEVFRRHNSGTYNNQWMVLDRKLVTAGAPLPVDTLWVVEQLPGLVEAADQTQVLQYGYWPSYNVPVYPNVFNLAGFPAAIIKQGPEMLSYQMCVRAQLFRKYQGTVVDLASFKRMLQYNQYETDPIQMGNPIYAVSARGDLCPERWGGPQLFGAIDCKVSSVAMAADGLRIDAFAGPTPQQKPFAWADHPKLAARNPHAGMPAMWNFSWTTI